MAIRLTYFSTSPPLNGKAGVKLRLLLKMPVLPHLSETSSLNRSLA